MDEFTDALAEEAAEEFTVLDDSTSEDTLCQPAETFLFPFSKEFETVDQHDLDHICWRAFSDAIMLAERYEHSDSDEEDETDDRYTLGQLDATIEWIEALGWAVDPVERASQYAEQEEIEDPTERVEDFEQFPRLADKAP